MREGFWQSHLAAYETPRIVRLAANLHAASFPLMKLLPARFMLDRAEADGKLTCGDHVVETTSGTFGLALAMLAAVRNYTLTLVTASSLLDEPFARRLRQLGAEIVVTPDPEGSGNQAGRLDRLKAILRERPDTFWPRQYDNPHNALAYARLAELVLRQLGQVDCLVACTGSGGSLCGTGGFLRALFPHLTLIAVDTHRSVLFGQPAGARLLRGLGNSIVPANLAHEAIDEVHWVGGLPAFAATRRLNRVHGLYMGPTSGAAFLVARWYARRNRSATTLVILADEGHRYHDTVYRDDWLADLQGWPPTLADEPVPLARPAPGGEAMWTRLHWQRRSLPSIARNSEI